MTRRKKVKKPFIRLRGGEGNRHIYEQTTLKRGGGKWDKERNSQP